jgi:hypothetical protein
MATRSMIGKMLPNGNVLSIYSHWDGYPEHNGVLLQKHYNSEAQVDLLLSHGDLSSLGSSIDSCVFYFRDRKESDIEAAELSMAEFIQQDYHYLWKDGAWLVANYEGYFEPLEMAL